MLFPQLNEVSMLEFAALEGFVLCKLRARMWTSAVFYIGVCKLALCHASEARIGASYIPVPLIDQSFSANLAKCSSCNLLTCIL